MEDEHLGDGVYASFDGITLWLAANDHRNKVIAIEPDILARLIGYARKVNATQGSTYFPVTA